MIKVYKPGLLAAMTVVTVLGCAKHSPVCCDGGYEYRNKDRFAAEKSSSDVATRLAALERERQRLADELAAGQKQNVALSARISDLERQLSDRDRDIASLRSGADDSSKLASRLSSTQGDLDQAKTRNAHLERQLAALQTSAGDKDRLAGDLAATQAQLAALQAGAGDKDKDKDKLTADLASAQAQLAALQVGAGDKDKLTADLAAARQRIAELETQLAAAQGSGAGNDKLASDLAAAKQRMADLERQLADRDKELASLHGDLSAEMAKLKEAQRGLVRALRPQIEKKNITVDLNNERLLINLASGYLFGSGEDELKPASADALKHVGAILKDYPEYKVAVDGHTDNRPIRNALKRKFPSNKELSEARAVNAAKALADGGLRGSSTAGYADTKSVAPNTTDAGRALNRRVEVRVTK